MFYDAIRNDHGFEVDPFKALVARPIGWLSTLSADGVANLAPYSFFNIVSERPHYVVFGSTGYKDSLRNIEATGEFAVNVATYPHPRSHEHELIASWHPMWMSLCLPD